MPTDTTTPPPVVLPAFKLQARDLVVLRAVARFGLLDATQIYRFIKAVCPPSAEPTVQRLKPKDPSGHSEVHLRRRLRALVAHGFLVLPPAQRVLGAFTFRAEGGSLPYVYCIGPAGAREVARFEHHLDPRASWVRKAREVSPYLILHTLATSDFMVRMLEDVSARGLSLLDHYDLISQFPASTAAHHTAAFQLSAVLPDHYRVALDPKDARTGALTVHAKPDRIFSVISADGTERTNFCLENDRETETIRPTYLTAQSSIRRKILAYLHAFKSDQHKVQWGFQNFRVLIETGTQSHLEAMVRLLEAEIPGGTALFLFGLRDEIQAHGPLAAVWTQRARGETRRISLLRDAISPLLTS